MEFTAYLMSLELHTVTTIVTVYNATKLRIQNNTRQGNCYAIQHTHMYNSKWWDLDTWKSC